jgi:hypothetical protein
MGIDHATTHASMLAESLQRFLVDEVSWESALSEFHTRARQWSEKSYRRTSTYAADFRPMTRLHWRQVDLRTQQVGGFHQACQF